MKLINRSAISIAPKASFINWIASLSLNDDEAAQYVNTPVGEHESSVYLLQEIETEADIDVQLSSNAASILKNEFSAWDEFGDDWPSSLLSDNLDVWFDFSLSVVAFDLAKTPLMMADLDRLDEV